MLVSLGRFELPAPGLGILCSIHLSYRDTEQIVAKLTKVVKAKTILKNPDIYIKIHIVFFNIFMMSGPDSSQILLT